MVQDGLRKGDGRMKKDSAYQGIELKIIGQASRLTRSRWLNDSDLTNTDLYSITKSNGNANKKCKEKKLCQ